MANIKIKLGNLELECEGAEEFLKTEIPNFLKLTLETFNQIPAQAIATNPVVNHLPPAHVNGGGGAIPGFKSTTESIAAKLGAKSAPELAVAAAARIVFVLGKDSFSRTELLAEMKTATAYYNTNISGNLTKILRGLVKGGEFNGIAEDSYAFSATTKTEIEAKIRVQA